MSRQIESAVKTVLENPFAYAPRARSDAADGGGQLAELLTLVKTLSADVKGVKSDVGGLSARMDSFEEARKEPHEEEPASDAEPEMSDEHGAKLDKIADHLGDLHGKLDSLHESHHGMKAQHDAVCKRLDALEAGKKHEVGNLENPGEPAPLAADADPDGEDGVNVEVDGEPKDDDIEAPEITREELAAEGDAVPEGLPEEREPNGLAEADSRHHHHRGDSVRADARMTKALEDATKRIKELERRVPAELPEDRRVKYVEAQERANRVYHAFGDSNGAPFYQNGETLNQYRRRLMRKFQPHSKTWSGVDLAQLRDDNALNIAEVQIYADAEHAAMHPTDAADDMLRPVRIQDQSGRFITKWVGSAKAAWAPFKHHRAA